MDNVFAVNSTDVGQLALIAAALTKNNYPFRIIWADVPAVVSATVTMTIASPGVVTWTGHGLQAGDAFQFSTTGALPTGVTAGTTYYVLPTGSDDQRLPIRGNRRRHGHRDIRHPVWRAHRHHRPVRHDELFRRAGDERLAGRRRCQHGAEPQFHDRDQLEHFDRTGGAVIMDILAIQPSTITVDIKHPATGAPIGLQVECVSLEDDRVKVVERQIKNRALKGGGTPLPPRRSRTTRSRSLLRPWSDGNGRPISPSATSKTRR
jgi:hypothetical protein